MAGNLLFHYKNGLKKIIPKIIWQTYESEYLNLDKKIKDTSSSWKKLNPEWEYNYVSEKERSKFVQEYFGDEWYNIYRSYKINVNRADLWRYMCIYINGGLYSDLDILCKKQIESWLDLNSKFVVSEEPDCPGYTQMIFAAEPNNIFLKNILKDIKEQYNLNIMYNNIKEYEAKETGYIIFNDSIIKTLKTKQDGFVSFTEKQSKIIHEDSIHHYRAGKGGVFKNYKAWQTERI